MQGIDFVWVGLGGGVGSLLRWLAGRMIGSLHALPSWAGTVIINVSGAFVIAYISTMLAIGWEHRYGDLLSSLVLTGILGGYTTFSTMQLGALDLSVRNPILPCLYLGGSVAAGLIAAAAGVTLARW